MKSWGQTWLLGHVYNVLLLYSTGKGRFFLLTFII